MAGREEGKKEGKKEGGREGRKKGRIVSFSFFKDSTTVICPLKISINLHVNVLY